jgi:hypothetical protein
MELALGDDFVMALKNDSYGPENDTATYSIISVSWFMMALLYFLQM